MKSAAERAAEVILREVNAYGGRVVVLEYVSAIISREYQELEQAAEAAYHFISKQSNSPRDQADVMALGLISALAKVRGQQ